MKNNEYDLRGVLFEHFGVYNTVFYPRFLELDPKDGTRIFGRSDQVPITNNTVFEVWYPSFRVRGTNPEKFVSTYLESILVGLFYTTRKQSKQAVIQWVYERWKIPKEQTQQVLKTLQKQGYLQVDDNDDDCMFYQS